MNSKSLPALLLCLCAALPARAIELSLEENKAERGNIGYIDMQKLFQTFPDTLRAKENFEELVRQAEEQLNLHKAEIIRARSELAELKIERDFMAKTPIEVQKPGERKAAVIEAPKGAAALAAAAEAAAREHRAEGGTENADLQKIMEQPAPTPSAGAPAAPTAPSQPVPAPAQGLSPSQGQTPPPSAATAPVPPTSPLAAASGAVPAAPAGRRGGEPETDLTRPSLENLPGFTPVPASSAPTVATPQQIAGAPAPAATPAPADQNENLREALEQSRRAAEAKQRQPLVINIPGVSTAPIVVTPPAEKPAAAAVTEKPAAPALPMPAPAETTAVSTQAAANLNPALVELDAKIAVKQKELGDKEQAYRAEQAASEKNLLDLESRKTEILLGKIHRAVQEVARREGVSVVVDKSSILYGHDAVDLTDKVMKYLRGS